MPSSQFTKTERVGNPAFSLLVSIGDVLEPEALAIGQQPQKVPRVLPACDHHDIGDAGIDERLDRIKDHRLVINGKQVLVGDFGERKQPAARASRKYDTFHMY